MKKEVCEGADGTSGYSTTHLRRSLFNIICVTAKNSETCVFVLTCMGARIHAKSRVSVPIYTQKTGSAGASTHTSM